MSFLSADKVLRVTVDGSCVYEFGVSDQRSFGQTPGSVVNFIDIPADLSTGDIRIEMVTFLAAFLIVTGLIHICKSLTNRKKAVLCAGIILVSGVFGFASYAVWLATCRSAVYGTPDNGKGNLYANRNIMVIVPHQDDEANLLSGVLEEYADYGSEIRAVYITNGDAGGIPETRLQEQALISCYGR